jgi:hypothetical protein
LRQRVITGKSTHETGTLGLSCGVDVMSSNAELAFNII